VLRAVRGSPLGRLTRSLAALSPGQRYLYSAQLGSTLGTRITAVALPSLAVLTLRASARHRPLSLMLSRTSFRLCWCIEFPSRRDRLAVAEGHFGLKSHRAGGTLSTAGCFAECWLARRS